MSVKGMAPATLMSFRLHLSDPMQLFRIVLTKPVYALFAIIMICVLCASLTACSDSSWEASWRQQNPDRTILWREKSEVTHAVIERCRADRPNLVNNLDGVFAEDWDRITVANSRVTYREVEDETNALFSDSIRDGVPDHPEYSIIVLQRNGIAVSAYEAEIMPVRPDGDSDMVSLPFPGEFTRSGSACIFTKPGP